MNNGGSAEQDGRSDHAGGFLLLSDVGFGVAEMRMTQLRQGERVNDWDRNPRPSAGDAPCGLAIRGVDRGSQDP